MKYYVNSMEVEKCEECVPNKAYRLTGVFTLSTGWRDITLAKWAPFTDAVQLQFDKVAWRLV